MDSITASMIAKQYHLIPGKTGRKILSAILNNQMIDAAILPEELTLEQIEYIRHLYLRKVQEIGQVKSPRNLIFYHLIKDKIPNFSWKIENSTPMNIQFDAPRVKNLRPSLISILLDRVDVEKDTLLNRKYHCIESLPTSFIKQLSQVMEQLEVIYPGEQGMTMIVNCLQAGLRGERITLFVPACPDYSVEATDDPTCPFRHNFKSLGQGFGLIIQRALTALPLLVDTLNKHRIQIDIVVGFGDFEAFSEANLRIFNITEKEFLDSVKKSKEKFQELSSIKARVSMITDLCGGQEIWKNYFNEFKDKLYRGDFGASQLTYKQLLNIAARRRDLYGRWYGKKASLEEYIPYVLNQGAEYAAMGAIFTTLSQTSLVLGADNDAMAPFYSVQQPIATLYLKRFYC